MEMAQKTTYSPNLQPQIQTLLRENIVPGLDDFSRRVAQRRQGGPSAVSGAVSLASGAAEAVSGLISQIPTKSVIQ